MNKYKKNLTDEDIQVLKNTMQKHNDIKSPIELMTQSIVTEQEKGLLKLMYFRFTDYVNQKQRADELEKLWSELVTFVKECDVVISKESENYPFMNDYEQAVIQGKENQIDNIIEKIEQLKKENDNA